MKHYFILLQIPNLPQGQQVTTCLRCFCFQGVDLLLLLFCCRIWWRTLCLSTGRTFKPLKSNVAAMTTVTSWKAGSQFQNKESARKPQNSPGFQQLCLSVAVPDTRWNPNKPEAILQTCPFSFAARRFHAISCYFVKETPTSTEDWLFRFSSSCRCCSEAALVAEACCASRRKKLWEILKYREPWDVQLTWINIWIHLTPFDCLSNCLSLVDKCTANITCRTTVRNRFKQVCGGPPQLQQACLWAAAPHQKTTLCTILAYISNSPC